MKSCFKRSNVRASLVLFVFFVSASLPAQTPVGVWQTIGDKGEDKGKVLSHIQIYEYDGKIGAKVAKLLKDPDAKCHADCPGNKANAPILGMNIMWGLKKTGDSKWEGEMLDPEDGLVYNCILSVNGNKLTVRGYDRFSPVSRTQTWLRLN
ncbi:MAG: DUF2147 domain-containing protein [Leptospiraceae bacterium]|nr:DUF2147 domain-containing protein [Leptospiraceae bacterium]